MRRVASYDHSQERQHESGKRVRRGRAGRELWAGRLGRGRRARSAPIVRDLRLWLDAQLGRVSQGSALAAAINRLARDPALRERFGKNGRRRVLDHFSWDAIARSTVDLYRSLIAAREER